eukprot:12750-Heterococcus_DN1.PRE.1
MLVASRRIALLLTALPGAQGIKVLHFAGPHLAFALITSSVSLQTPVLHITAASHLFSELLRASSSKSFQIPGNFFKQGAF